MGSGLITKGGYHGRSFLLISSHGHVTIVVMMSEDLRTGNNEISTLLSLYSTPLFAALFDQIRYSDCDYDCAFFVCETCIKRVTPRGIQGKIHQHPVRRRYIQHRRTNYYSLIAVAGFRDFYFAQC
jgi:hypothetical protein